MSTDPYTISTIIVDAQASLLVFPQRVPQPVTRRHEVSSMIRKAYGCIHLACGSHVEVPAAAVLLTSELAVEVPPVEDQEEAAVAEGVEVEAEVVVEDKKQFVCLVRRDRPAALQYMKQLAERHEVIDPSATQTTTTSSRHLIWLVERRLLVFVSRFYERWCSLTLRLSVGPRADFVSRRRDSQSREGEAAHRSCRYCT